VAKRLLILSDGRAGHVSSSRGIAALIGARVDCAVEEMEIRLRAKGFRPLLRALVNSGWGDWLLERAPNWPKLFYKGYAPHAHDLVISAGGDTIYLNALLGRNARNVFCGSLRGVEGTRFDQIVHIRPDSARNWQAMEVLPSSADPEAAARAAESYADQWLDGRRQGYWALLIGGDGSGYRYDATALVEATRQLAELARRHGRRLLISTSRRTGADVETALDTWLGTQPEAPVARLVLYNRRPERVATTFMALADWVFCTEDSVSMISEAVLLRRPLITLLPESARPGVDHRALVTHLADKGRLWRVPLGQVGDLDGLAVNWRAYERDDQTELQARLLAILGDATPPSRRA
jgi:mitochondrial fission protein ELM1